MNASDDQRYAHKNSGEHGIVELNDSKVDVLHLAIRRQSESSEYKVHYKHPDTELIIVIGIFDI